MLNLCLQIRFLRFIPE